LVEENYLLKRSIELDAIRRRYYGELVSVVLPVYNDEETIEESLQSICRQTYNNFEVIVVNDGCTDSTPTLLRNIASHNKKIRIITTSHVGTSEAKNIGLKSSQGSVIFFAEGDAIYDPTYLDEAIKCLDLDIRNGGVCVLGEPWLTRETFVTMSMCAEKMIIHEMIRRGRLEPYYSWVFPKHVLDEVGAFDPKLSQAEDRDLFARVKKRGYRIGLVNKVLWHHKRDETLPQFLRKCYIKGKKRVDYLAKNRRYLEFVRGIIGLWGLAIILLLFLFSPIIATESLVIALVLFLVRYSRILFVGLKIGIQKRWLFLLPLFQILRYLGNAAGYTAGVFIRSIRGSNKSKEFIN
jgi:glycosyltransferase involved in cell wall biosynthesis